MGDIAQLPGATTLPCRSSWHCPFSHSALFASQGLSSCLPRTVNSEGRLGRKRQSTLHSSLYQNSFLFQSSESLDPGAEVHERAPGHRLAPKLTTGTRWGKPRALRIPVADSSQARPDLSAHSPPPGQQRLQSHVQFALSLNGGGGHVTQNRNVILLGLGVVRESSCFPD